VTRTALYYCSTISLIIGSFLLGYGTGKLFDKTCEGILIGLGVGLLLTALISFRIHKRLLAFNKDNV
jgi:hypothetical protein